MQSTRDRTALRCRTAATLCALAALSTARSAPAEEPRGVVVATQAVQPHACAAPDGTVHVAMIRAGNVEVATSTDDGRTFTAPVVAIDGKGHATGGRQRGPRIGADREGHLVVTAPLSFDEAEWKRRHPRADLWIVRSRDRGKTWTRPLRVNEAEKEAPEALHWTAVAPDGTAHVAWLDHRDGGRREDLYYARVTGERVGKNVRLVPAVCECCAPGLALDGRGDPVVAVREGGEGDRGILLLRSRDGGDTFGPAERANVAESNVHG